MIVMKLLVPVVHDVRREGKDPSDNHDPGTYPEQPPGRVRAGEHGGAADHEPDHDDRDRRPGGAPAVVRWVLEYLQPVRAGLLDGASRRLIGHAVLLSSLPLLLFSGKCETEQQPAHLQPCESVWWAISPTMACWAAGGTGRGHQPLLRSNDPRGARREVPAIVDNVLRAGEGRILRKLKRISEQINSIEEDFTAMSDADLRGLTAEFKQRYADGETLDDLLPEAFGAVREAARRTLSQRAFDVQLMGAAALHLGNIAEMKTGEGKTLTGVFPAYLNALAGEGVHVVTVNDYLAKRDSEWMGRVHHFLGLDRKS